MQLNAHLLHARRGQLNAPLGQLVPVVVVQNAAVLARVRQYVVIGPQQEEILRRVAVVPGDLADGHLVQGHGNGPHAVLGQHLAKQAGKFVQLHELIAQNLHELVQHAAENLPELGRLLRVLEPSGLRLGPQLGFQGVLQVQFLHKTVKGIRFLTRCFSQFQALGQSIQRSPHPAAQLVDPGQLFRPLLRQWNAVAVGILRPIHVPQPHLAVDIPLEHIVFQQVALLGRQPR